MSNMSSISYDLMMLHRPCWWSLLPCCRLDLRWSHHVRSQTVPRLSPHVPDQRFTLPKCYTQTKFCLCHQRINQNTAYTQFRLGLPGFRVFRVLGFGFLSLSFEKNAGPTKGFEHVKGYAGSIASKRLVFSETVKHERGVKHQQLNRNFTGHVMSYLDQMHSLWKLRPGSGIVSEPKASIHR